MRQRGQPQCPSRPRSNHRPRAVHNRLTSRARRPGPASPVRARRPDPANPVRVHPPDPVSPVRAHPPDPASPVRAHPPDPAARVHLAERRKPAGPYPPMADHFRRKALARRPLVQNPRVRNRKDRDAVPTSRMECLRGVGPMAPLRGPNLPYSSHRMRLNCPTTSRFVIWPNSCSAVQSILSRS